IEAALERVRGLGYQSDAGFAESLVRSRRMNRGRVAIAEDLAERGVDRTLAGQALAAITPDIELDAARRVAARLPDVEPSRLGGRLQRRGFTSDTVRRVLRERAAARGEEPPD
ncbi:MAG: RecX family transcriptional regulator, partial [Candidatus Dormibacteraeota bacterium]|nr:RecX family transcriptional regulator [Candidatus Dormibacteraeota bacterium]